LVPTVESNGIRLAYEVHGHGQPLLLVTGVGYGGWFWHRLVPYLAPHYQVITFDNRGSGGSDKPAGPYATRQLADDALGLVDALGLSRLYVMGHSLGGFIAQELVLARPALVARLILSATTHGGPNVIPIGAEALAVLTDRSGDPVELVRRGIAIAAAPGFAERHPDLAQQLLAYRLTNPVPPAQYAAQVMAGAQHNAEARIGQIACPTLVLFGADDRVVPPGNAERLASRIPGAQFRLLTGLGHIFPLEDPEATAGVVLEFLSA
jgi:pimeloyl-ACP methyl ester carboxylesterase